MKRQFNVKLFIWLLGGTIAFGLSFYVIHFLQAGRTSRGLVRIADKAEAEKDLNNAANYLQRYLKFVPEDTDALARLGLILDKQAVTRPNLRERAFFVLDQVLRRDPERADVRRKVVRLAMSMRGYSDAIAHLEILKADAPTDGELYHLLGSCEAGRGKFSDAIKALEKAIQYPPKEVESYVLMAELLWRKRDDAKRADEIMLQMVNEKKSVPAYLARAAYLRRRGHAETGTAEQDGFLKSAGKDIEEARRLEPNNVDVRLESAEWQLAQSKPGLDNATLFDEARKYVEQALKLHPKEPRLYLLLSRLERMAARPEKATEALQRGLKEVPVENQADLLFILADLSIDQGSLSAAGDYLSRLREKRFPSPAMSFLDAFVLVKKGDWLPATRALEAVRPALAEWPQLNGRVEFLLGQCYEQLGDPDQQYTAFRRALTADPLSLPALNGMGQALIAMGRPDDAMDAYRRLMAKVPEAKLTVARLLVERNLGLPKNQRVWDEVDILLKESELYLTKSTPTPQNSQALLSECYLLKAEATAAREDLNRTREVLLAAPDGVDIRIALANIASRKLGGMEEAQQIIDEAEKKFGDRVEIRLARVLQIRRRGKDSEALVRLTEGIDEFKVNDQRRLLRECAKVCAMLGDPGRSEQLFRRLEEMRPADLTIKLALFDLALETDNHQAANALIAKMREIEGVRGPRWRYATACQMIWRAAKENASSANLEEARALLNALAAERPNWYRIAVSQGQVSELLGKREAAIAQYLQAIDLGERNPAFVHRLCQLLYQAQRFPEAAQVMHKLPEGVVLQGDMRQMSVDLSLRSQDYTQALKLAKKAVEDNSNDYRNHLWLAQVHLAMNDEQKQAEPELRKAVALASDVPATWVALIQYLAFTDQKEKAAAEIANAAKALPTKQAPLALAQCYVALGNREQAQLHYQKALAAQPEDIPTLQGAADFYLRTGQSKDAEKYLRQIIALKSKSPEAAASAQLVLAYLMIRTGDNYEKSRDALVSMGMLADTGRTGDPGDETIEQLRAKAVTLAMLKHRPDRLAAIRILLKMRERQPLTSNDQFLLAQLYESVGSWPKAHVEFSALVSKDGKNFAYLTQLALGSLRHGQIEEVPPLLAKLEELAKPKGSFADTGAVAEIKARLLHAQGESPKAVQELRRYAEKNEDRLPFIAALLEELRQLDAAEAMFRQFVEKSKVPENCLVLARYLGRHRRLDEALDICQKAAPTCRPEALAAASLHILYSAKPKPSADQCQRVEKLLTAAIKQEKKVALLDYLGAYHNLQGNFAEAEAAFREALALDGNDPTALNNLSWLLAFQPQKNAEALRLVQHVISITGPYPGVLDTRGVIYLAGGRTDDAVKDLEDVVAEGPTASHYFHLAQAHQQAKNRPRAMTALAEANRLGLSASALHPLERAAYEQLCIQVGMEKK